MKTLTYILTFLTLFFGGNVVAFIFIDDYRFLLRKIKYPEMTVYVNETEITDSYWIIEVEEPERKDVFVEEVRLPKEIIPEVVYTETEKLDTEVEVIPGLEKIVIEEDNNEGPSKTPEIIEPHNFEFFSLTEFDRNFLLSFSEFDLSEKDSPSNLFWFIFDYEKDFWKYSSDKIDLYFMWDVSYNEIKTFLESNPASNWYTINEVNNFWEKSLYINKEPFIVRLLLEVNSRVYMLEVIKPEYEKVKQILNSL